MHFYRLERSWLTSSWLEIRPAANLRSEDCVRRERKRDTSVCICEIEKVRDRKFSADPLPTEPLFDQILLVRVKTKAGPTSSSTRDSPNQILYGQRLDLDRDRESAG